MERVCHEQKGHSLEQMATALMTAFLEAKMRRREDERRPLRGESDVTERRSRRKWESGPTRRSSAC